MTCTLIINVGKAYSQTDNDIKDGNLQWNTGYCYTEKYNIPDSSTQLQVVYFDTSVIGKYLK